MTETTRVPLASELLAEAVAQINKNDAEGAVSQMKTLIVMVQTNDKKIASIQKHSADLLKKITELTAAGGLDTSRFSEQA